MREELLSGTAATPAADAPANEKKPRVRSIPVDQALLCSIDEGSDFIDCSRAEIYRKIAREEISAVKHGRRTSLVVDSLRQYVARLPKA